MKVIYLRNVYNLISYKQFHFKANGYHTLCSPVVKNYVRRERL